ncbi:MAG: GerMN domain-containing protein [Candidatus Aminicenantes bacterium]|nr:GerMN domain-containing protein [Candidatus Aminicenantes bacterium]
MNKKLIYTLVAIAFIFFITSLIIFLKSKKEVDQKDIKEKKTDIQTDIGEPQFQKVKLFFYTYKSRYMSPVLDELENSEIKSDMYRKLIQLIMQGKEDYITPIPQGLRLRTLYYVEKEKLLVLDFNDNLVTRFPSGSSAELEFIYFMVDNICFNFEEVEKVKFLVSGNEYRTISGHIDIENPFYPDYRYLRLN